MRQLPRVPIHRALDRLANLFPFGIVHADTDPAGFLNAVADEIERLRAASPATGMEASRTNWGQPGTCDDAIEARGAAGAGGKGDG